MQIIIHSDSRENSVTATPVSEVTIVLRGQNLNNLKFYIQPIPVNSTGFKWAWPLLRSLIVGVLMKALAIWYS